MKIKLLSVVAIICLGCAAIAWLLPGKEAADPARIDEHKPVAAAASAAATSEGPSFSCDSARTSAEKMICADAGLAAADREMARLYALAKTSAFGFGPSNQLEQQRYLVRDVNACAQASDAEDCIKSRYDDRNLGLAIAVAPHAPQVAWPVIHRLDPQYAPVLEALTLWAAEPVDADWSAPARARSRAHIIALLQPYLANIQRKLRIGLSWDPLSDYKTPVGKIEDIFQSDQHFAKLMQVIGPEMERWTTSQSLPCSAIMRHPDLLLATRALYGSFADVRLFETDCARTLPPTPALTSLYDKVNDSMTDCDGGTIRYSLGANLLAALEATRLGQSYDNTEWASYIPPSVGREDLAAARNELARYYATYLKLSPADAAKRANEGVNTITSKQFRCEFLD